MRTLSRVLLAASLVTSPALAQNAGTVELGVFGRAAWFDYLKINPGIHTGGGVGGRLGVFFLRNLELEGDASYVDAKSDSTGSNVSHLGAHGRLTYNFPMGDHVAFLLGGGYGYNRYRKSFKATDNGPGGIIGLRLGTGKVLSARIEGTVDYLNNPANNGDRHWNLGANFGLSLLFGQHAAKPEPVLAPPPAAAPAPAPADEDHDGVVDSADRCPGTPAGESVHTDGCSASQLDGDRDGVMDNVDQCPTTPAGDSVDATGCTIQGDADSDGVLDSLDRCPATPKDDFVDANGCSLPKDSDGDGVTDDKDRCPGTPGGNEVNVQGCTVVSIFQPGTTALVLEGVNFETGKATLLPASREVLDQVAAKLIANPDVRVEVQGHTDNRGGRALNLKLSEARANSVMQYLVEHGVAADRMTAKGYGPDKPIDTNATAAGRARNRRVELDRIE